MPSRSLRATIDSLAQDFASAVIDAIRAASVDEIAAQTAPALRRGPGRPRLVKEFAAPQPAYIATEVGGERLARRSVADLERTLGIVVAAVKTHGMRAEELQRFLSLDKRELPRVLALGLSKKILTKSGQKRATVYSAT